MLAQDGREAAGSKVKNGINHNTEGGINHNTESSISFTFPWFSLLSPVGVMQDGSKSCCTHSGFGSQLKDPEV